MYSNVAPASIWYSKLNTKKVCISFIKPSSIDELENKMVFSQSTWTCMGASIVPVKNEIVLELPNYLNLSTAFNKFLETHLHETIINYNQVRFATTLTKNN